MKLVLAGEYGTTNLGDQGMLAVLRERMIEQTDAELTVLSRHPSAEYEALYRVRTIPDLFDEDEPKAAHQWFHGFNRGDSKEHLLRISESIREADWLVLGGGRMFFDHSGNFMNGGLSAYAQLVSLAHFLGTPVMLFGMTVATETSRIARDYLRFIAEGSELITVREIQSRDNLVELGIDGDQVQVLPDPTLGLPFLEPSGDYGLQKGSVWLDEANALLGQLEVEPDRRIIAVNVRSYAWRDGAEGQTRSEKLLAELLDEVIQNTGAQLLFIPQMTSDSTNPEELDDRLMSGRVIGLMKESSSCTAVVDELSIWQALALYRQCSMLLSMRRHGLTFAVTQHVPVLAIAMDDNIEFLTSSLGIPQNSVRLVPGRIQRVVEQVLAVLDAEPEHHASLFAYVDDCAARTRVYAELLTGRD
ncbi:MAG: polysaccharide pyruvyl transferase WcaK-like protein [Planctomycetota bacterium]|jgi:polysaccharide pyruvyl transferase WcaK-like protein